jgi:hypothetical protein
MDYFLWIDDRWFLLRFAHCLCSKFQRFYLPIYIRYIIHPSPFSIVRVLQLFVMHRTIALRKPSILHRLQQESVPKLLLPTESLFHRCTTAVMGWWSLLNQKNRDLYTNLVQDGVIKDSVLQRAPAGIFNVFSLFYKLKDPVWEKYDFDAKGFVNAIGPAIENFYDISERLRNEVRTNEEEINEMLEMEKIPHETLVERLAKSTDEESLTAALLGKNHWRERAENDPGSLEAQLLKMCTDQCFDASYYSAKFGAAQSMKSMTGKRLYIEGSCNVDNVALMNARTDVKDERKVTSLDDIVESIEASDAGLFPVAAQIDVLCEISVSYTLEEPIIDDSERNDKLSDTNTQSDGKADTKQITKSISDISVAVLEGWIHKGPNNRLQWKLAMLRPAYEFSHVASISTPQA